MIIVYLCGLKVYPARPLKIEFIRHAGQTLLRHVHPPIPTIIEIILAATSRSTHLTSNDWGGRLYSSSTTIRVLLHFGRWLLVTVWLGCLTLFHAPKQFGFEESVISLHIQTVHESGIN